MPDKITKYIDKNRDRVSTLMDRYISLERPFLLKSDISEVFQEFCHETNDKELGKSPLGKMLCKAQEATFEVPWIYFAVRQRIAQWYFARYHTEEMNLEKIPVAEFLKFKERFVEKQDNNNDWLLEIDLTPFERGFPKLKESRSIGRGVEFLNRHLSSRLFADLGKGDKRLLNFLHVHKHRGMQLMLNDQIKDVDELQEAIRSAEDYLAQEDPEALWSDVGKELQSLGFEPGWGRTASQMRDTLKLLSDVLEAPDHYNLELFLGHIPMIFNIVILSPHGYFGQENVLGLPDTGGQVVYILDQVRALEKEMRKRFYDLGLDFEPRILVVTRLIPEAGNSTCDQAREPIMGTENAIILRVPFRSPDGDVVPHWISRFNIWPFLEQFTIEVEKEILAELQVRPDLVIGNYSDGNLVASLLTERLGVTQCNIAHALEKTKYLFSDLYWKDNEPHYHFSCQFTADLIAMNTADFIITSTYEEIAGNDDTIGQYESYNSFTMPDLYRVISGIDVFDPKFNIVSPGADPEIFFPLTEKKRRLRGLHDEIDNLVFGQDDRPDARGKISNGDKPMLFTLARLDRIKNITGLVRWFGESEELRKQTNLLVVAAYVDENQSSDTEEIDQIRIMHQLFDQYKLDDQVRWIGGRLEKKLVGELYRYVADKRGAFVQPALFEAFGLTVIEAMASGLPTFATRYGGPLEIIKNGVSGFHIDPNYGDQVTQIMSEFFDRCAKKPDYWLKISEESVRRVESRYTWKRYADRLMTLSCIYGFWNYVTNLDRQETCRYLEMFYNLQFRQLAQSI